MEEAGEDYEQGKEDNEVKKQKHIPFWGRRPLNGGPEGNKQIVFQFVSMFVLHATL